ncbi:sigma-54-dependent transcriptional regulator [Desulfohalobium retbaense]|uniref:Two component, sigma54 specific, transcriptional regulator, Fis family n=1 Tax=Desulfohalobium retbaense (strain ATCC 49708 / DSM 5692 / JCM 16813 / HR100) TaxID=485915 RepID=C8WYS9_DESRD|nr:sigma-54 dependent transcriptional regulator [Desulfohalobium retbaense]ACV67845.1 two component, sigma54 specific, transcriptional regulator, Fis family [Desulfohalobium retbaense DSM 5692]
MQARILVVDDELDIRVSLSGILEDEGHTVMEADSGEAGLTAMAGKEIDLVFLDIWLPGMDGLAVLERLRQEWPDIPVIMISGHGTIETAVSAIKNGAHDFIEKPLSLEKVVITANKALEFSKLKRENRDLRSRVKTDVVQEISGSSGAIASLRAQIDRVAPTDAWVLISGENGTGKEIVARSLHVKSRRAKRPMIAVNCAAIPEELIESELFGHEKGAFTGAEQAQRGKFELAHKGTLFLDEIGDMSLKTQAKVLRILQEQSFERVGGRKTLNVDVRVIAATNKDLPQEIQAGRFREDLYYRLKVFPLEVPPLRLRMQDVPDLLQEFVALLSREHGFKPLSFTPEALRRLQSYSWPGNVRELKNFVERMLIMYAGDEVGPEHLPGDVEAPMAGGHERGVGWDDDFKNARARFEKDFLTQKLEQCGGNVAQTAEQVGLERSYLYRKLKGYGLI